MKLPNPRISVEVFAYNMMNINPNWKIIKLMITKRNLSWRTGKLEQGICANRNETGNNTLLRVNPTLTHYSDPVSDIPFEVFMAFFLAYTLEIISSILSGILSGIYSDILSGSLASGIYSTCPASILTISLAWALPTEIWSLRLRSSVPSETWSPQLGGGGGSNSDKI